MSVLPKKVGLLFIRLCRGNADILGWTDIVGFSFLELITRYLFLYTTISSHRHIYQLLADRIPCIYTHQARDLLLFDGTLTLKAQK